MRAYFHKKISSRGEGWLKERILKISSECISGALEISSERIFLAKDRISCMSESVFQKNAPRERINSTTSGNKLGRERIFISSNCRAQRERILNKLSLRAYFIFSRAYFHFSKNHYFEHCVFACIIAFFTHRVS